MSDRAAEIRSRYLRICAMDDSLSAQSTGAAIAYSLDVPWLVERVAELEAALSDARQTIASLSGLVKDLRELRNE
jgi:type II secretory pathway component PulM